MKRLILSILLLASQASAQAVISNAQLSGVSLAAPAGHTDFTASIEYCWAIVASTGGTNNCTAGSGGNGTVNGAPTYVVGPAGSHSGNRAVDMNGGSDITIADSVFGTEANTLTWGTWLLDEGADSKIVMHKGTVTFLETTIVATNKLRGRSSATMITPTDVMGTVWKHYAMTISGTTTRLYINGVEDCGGTCPSNGTGHADNSVRLTLGADSSDSGIIPGAIYESFYDNGTILTASQICSIAKWGIDGLQDHTSLVSCTE